MTRRQSVFTAGELDYLRSEERRLGHVATVGRDGTPHVVPTGWRYDAEHDTVDIAGADLTRTKKYRDLLRDPSVAFVVDDVLPPWRPRCIEIRGTAELIEGDEPRIRIHPRRIISWGLDGDGGTHHARDVERG